MIETYTYTLMELDEKTQIVINQVIEILMSHKFGFKEKIVNQCIDCLYNIGRSLKKENEPELREYLINFIDDINNHHNGVDINNIKIEKLLAYLYVISKIPHRQQKGAYIYNSAHYYDEEIKKIENEKDILIKQIESLKVAQENKDAEKKNIIQQKEEEVKKLTDEIKKYEAEKKEQNKIKDAIELWNEKIQNAFKNLTEYINPIVDEHKRLCFLYKCYRLLSALFICILIVTECFICYKFASDKEFPTWERYFSIILPIPIALALLWGFITQMNRAQRQMVILAKQIHEIKYVEGLLLTINTLSTDINESMHKVNTAILKLLDNHLNYKDNLLIDELALKKEEHKDSMPYEVVIKLLKEINSLTSKK